MQYSSRQPIQTHSRVYTNAYVPPCPETPRHQHPVDTHSVQSDLLHNGSGANIRNPSDAVSGHQTSWPPSSLSSPGSYNNCPSHHATWFESSVIPTQGSALLPYNYEQAPYDLSEYPLQAPLPQDVCGQPLSYAYPQQITHAGDYFRTNNGPISPSTTHYIPSPTDNFSQCSYFSPMSSMTSDQDDLGSPVDAPFVPVHRSLALPSPAQLSKYSELSHALDEGSFIPMVVKSHPHPADKDDPPMGSLRPDSPTMPAHSPSPTVSTPSSASVHTPASAPASSLPPVIHQTSASMPPATVSSSSQVYQLVQDASAFPKIERKNKRPRENSTASASSCPRSPTHGHGSVHGSPFTTAPLVSSTASLQDAPANVPGTAHHRLKPPRGSGVMSVGTNIDSDGKQHRKKPALACLFCRERKIACSLPPEGNDDRRCNQCVKRARSCEMPTESRRGQYQRRKKDKPLAPEREASSASVPTVTEPAPEQKSECKESSP